MDSSFSLHLRILFAQQNKYVELFMSPDFYFENINKIITPCCFSMPEFSLLLIIFISKLIFQCTLFFSKGLYLGVQRFCVQLLSGCGEQHHHILTIVQTESQYISDNKIVKCTTTLPLILILLIAHQIQIVLKCSKYYFIVNAIFFH